MPVPPPVEIDAAADIVPKACTPSRHAAILADRRPHLRGGSGGTGHKIRVMHTGPAHLARPTPLS